MRSTLAPIYLDRQPVSLADEPSPMASRVVAAMGKQPDEFEIMLLRSETDTEGLRIELDYVIDRMAEPTKPIYLTCIPKPSASSVEGTDEASGEPSMPGSLPPLDPLGE